MVEKRLLKDVDKTDLTDGGQTSLHSHAGGGGGGLVDKGGSVTTDGSGEATVSFNTNYSDTNYFIQLTAVRGPDTAVPMLKSGTKTISGFTIIVEDDRGGTEGSLEVLWCTGPYSNP